MPNRVPAVRRIKARHPSMGTSFMTDVGVCFPIVIYRCVLAHTMRYPSYARNRACALPTSPPFHYVRADSARNAVELTLCQLSRFNSVSPESENVWPIGSKL